MRTIRPDGIALLAAFGCLIGCAPSSDGLVASTALATASDNPDGAHLSREVARFIAQEAAVREGINLSDFNEPEARFEFTQKDGTWSVFFEGKVANIGNHFLVTVDDQTCGTRLDRGR